MRDGDTVRVLIADGQAFFRAGFAQVIGAMPGLEVVGLAGDVEQTVRLVSEVRPDVAVLDVALPGGGGIEATAFRGLSDEAWGGLATEARALVAFLADRDPTVYSRYSHWWKTLPSGEVRLLPG